MAIIEITGGPITHHYLMGKTKTEIASMYMRLLHDTEQDANDAARYRWLRDSADSYTWDYLGGIGAGRVDAAIDAAMAKESGQ